MNPVYSDISEAEYRTRITQAQGLMREQGLEAILVSSAVNSYYFTGFDSLQLYPPEDDITRALILRSDGEPVWITSQGFRRGFEACAWPAEIRTYGGGVDQATAFMQTWKELGLVGKKVGAELGIGSNRVDLPAGIFLDLARVCSFVDASGLIDAVRLTKSEEEQRRLQMAAEISDRAFKRLVPELRVGMTERRIANLLGAYMLEEGADRPYYVLVRVAERYMNSLYCVLPIEREIRQGDFVKIEYSADYRHYVNESKSLVLAGRKPTPSERDHFQLLAEAMKAGAKAARPDATVADVFYAQKQVLEEAGITVSERRSFGHGTGLNCHEPPVVGPQDKTRLRAGMVFVLEPGNLGNARGLHREMSNADTVIVRTSGPAERLPPFSEEIITI